MSHPLFDKIFVEDFTKDYSKDVIGRSSRSNYVVIRISKKLINVHWLK